MRKRSILTFILLAFIFGASIIYIPKWQLHDRGIENAKERIMLENQLRGSLAQILGWTLVLIGLYFVMRRMTAAERTAELSKQAQVSERFTRAINQLAASYTNGKKRLEIRVGGIYGLEGIARESSEYYWPVMEILTAYVRENASWEEKIQDPSERLKVVGKESKTDPLYTLYPKLPADIQALLTVIGRRGLSYLNGEDHRINLAQTNLRGATLMGANLRGALLLRTNLQKARFTKSNLSDALLDESQLEEADLNYANLQGASLKKGRLQRAYLMGANIRQGKMAGAFLQGADLRGADLRGADLEQANLEAANLQKAKLGGANLRGANLLGASLEGADLERADLRVCDLRESNLREANLWGAILQGANLLSATLEGANLKGADLRVANLKEAILQEANLENSNLEKANLQKAYLRRANLRKARGVPAELLSEVETLYAVKIGSQLKKQIKKDYPHLLEKP